MASTERFAVDFAEHTYEHIEAIELKYHSLIEQAVLEQLCHQPTVTTKNRKRLRTIGPFGAEWELRCGPDNRFRIFYTADETARAVAIVAVAVKERDRLFIAGKEVMT
jgi:hypothetical protein